MAQLHACPASHASFAASAAWALAKRTEASPRSARDKPNPAPWPPSKNTPSSDTLSIPRRSTGGTYHAQGTGTFETPKQALAKQLRLVPNRKPRPRSSGRHLWTTLPSCNLGKGNQPLGSFTPQSEEKTLIHFKFITVNQEFMKNHSGGSSPLFPRYV